MRVPAICLAALVACGGGQRSSGPMSNQSDGKPSRAIAGDPLAVLPIDSELVFQLDVQRLRASATWQRVEPQLLAKAGPVFSELKTACGIDPLATVTSIAGGLRGLGDPMPTGVIVVRGIDRTKGMACLEQQRGKPGAKIALERDIAILTADGSPPISVVFADASTLVLVPGVGQSAEVDRVLASGVPLKGSPAFTTLLTSIRTTDPLWFVINGNARLFDQAAGLGVKPKAMLGSFDLATGLAGTIRVRLDTPDQAQQLATLANGQVGMAKSFFQRLDVSSDKTDFLVEARMTQDQLDTALQLLAGAFSSGVNPGP
jgi:hypothetical protein